MIKRTLLLIGFLLNSIFIIGQNSKIDIGIEGGISYISLRGNNLVEYMNDDLSYGFLSSLNISYNFSEYISLKTSIGYERKGTSVNDLAFLDEFGSTICNEECKYKLNLDYLTIPLFIQFTYGNKINLFANTGPYIGFLLKGKEVINGAPNQTSDIENIVTNNFKKTDFGISFGIGAKYNIKEKFFISLEIRDNLGLINISSVPVVNDDTIKTNSIIGILGIGYKI